MVKVYKVQACMNYSMAGCGKLSFHFQKLPPPPFAIGAGI